MTNKPQPLIDKDANIGELVMQYPELSEILMEDYGMHCVSCAISSFDTLEMGAQVHGMGDKEIDEMVERLNTLVAKK